jgi:hypothetical protein
MERHQALKLFAAGLRKPLVDPDSGKWLVPAYYTKSTIDDFIESSRTWFPRAPAIRGKVAQFPYIYWPGIRKKKGQPLRDVTIVDFGDVRVVLREEGQFFSSSERRTIWYFFD